MDITTLAAWGEFLGGIAVVVSLIYLASQIRQNTRIIRASNSREYLTGSSQLGQMLVDPETASLYLVVWPLVRAKSWGDLQVAQSDLELIE